MTKQQKQAERINEFRSLLIRAYNHGYERGHMDTVEGCFIPIYRDEVDNYHHELVDEIIEDFLNE